MSATTQTHACYPQLCCTSVRVAAVCLAQQLHTFKPVPPPVKIKLEPRRAFKYDNLHLYKQRQTTLQLRDPHRGGHYANSAHSRGLPLPVTANIRPWVFGERVCRLANFPKRNTAAAERGARTPPTNSFLGLYGTSATYPSDTPKHSPGPPSPWSWAWWYFY